jgi:hypothetical protein
MTVDDDHETLLDELRLLVNQVDPVPADVTKFADAALGWRRIDAELADLLSDTALESAVSAAAVRGGERARSVTFRSSDLEIDLEIQRADGRVTILGQLAPAGRAWIEVQRDDESTVAPAEADDLGRFRLELAEAGRVRLRVARDEQAPVETSWIST